MIPAHLIKPILEFLVTAVFQAEKIFGPGTGDQKRKDAIVKTVNKVYDIGDAVLQLPDVTDDFVKNKFVPDAVEKAWSWFNQNGFDQGDELDEQTKGEIVAFVSREVPEINEAA